ncbi:MAG TPA: acyl-CoA dehydrogenase family protein [Syntrophales bacterium]|nr:acyl-CoA/acyl-ACP dehydrogenase [Syntrophales bacterium]MDD5232081.1 acyl-CoA/acyl-ACP dehydrogenase [Syntrophales bacterium]MDD5533135.1 acyl-CoA/acyl-ACP dehydrogenase [Syntrophales bacterium]HRR40722.1 acyl-CoA dehydrogenase family protein [Syntrophales bacterium]
MIDYELTSAQKELRERTALFCASEIAPSASALDSAPRDEAGRIVREAIKKLGKAGYLDLLVNGDFVSRCVAGEELARSCPSTFFSAMYSGTSFGLAIKSFGSRAQQDRYLPGIISGERIGALACTEDSAGSDLSLIETRAELGGDKWILTGSKDFVTNAPVADFFLVSAWTDREAGCEKGLSFFVVDRGISGFDTTETVETMGLRGAPAAGIRLSRCSVPAGNLLGKAGQGHAILGCINEWLKISLSAMSLGIGVACMEVSTSYSKSRSAFGRPIGLFEGVGAKLAIMFTNNDLGRMLTLRAAWSMDRREAESSVLASCAKLFTSESANKTADLAMQVHGGHGYIKGTAIERLYRDARFAELACGTSEMQRAFIARDSLNR